MSLPQNDSGSEKSLGLAEIPHEFAKSKRQKIWGFILRRGLETQGLEPIPEDLRTADHLYELFFVCFTGNMTLAPSFVAGTAGPIFFNLDLRTTLVILLVSNAISAILPSYFMAFGSKLGTRGIVASRFSWGFYGSVIPAICNSGSNIGFLVLILILGGQSLASVSSSLDVTVGIVITVLVSLLVAFFGYQLIHHTQRFIWIPTAFTFIVMLGTGGKTLGTALASAPTNPLVLRDIMTFTSTTMSAMIAWFALMPDYSVWHSSHASSLRVFVYAFLGLFMSTTIGNVLGALFAAAIPFVPLWKEGLGPDGEDIGGLVAAILAPAGGFGKFLIVLMALSMWGVGVTAMYSFGMGFMAISPVLTRTPRWVFPIVAAAIALPVAIVGERTFYSTIVIILSLAGYWGAPFSAIVMTEHVVFRKCRWSSYRVENWNSSALLPCGIAATLSFLGSVGLMVPFLDQDWYSGPIGKKTGDMGFFVGFGVSIALYVPLRTLERRLSPERTS